MLKRIRHFKDVKKDFLLGKEDAYFIVYSWILYAMITTTYLLCSMLLVLLMFFKIIDKLAIPLCIVLLIVYQLFLFWSKAKQLVEPYAIEILKLFSKYGCVVTREYWKRIRKNAPRAYRILNSNKSKGYCYYMSWYVALYLKDAELLYCSMDIRGKQSCHSVIKKGDCIYCTNSRMHFDLAEWIEANEVEIYRTFKIEEYSNKKFFDNIRDDLVEWCEQRNVYCSPQKSPIAT